MPSVLAACILRTSVINQDPYPAIPGDYVRVVFQLDGINNPECGNVSFSVLGKYPFSLDSEISSTTTIKSGIYYRNYQSYAIIPYDLRVDENAIDGANRLEVFYGSNTVANILKDFSIEVEDARTDFEVYITDYIQQERKFVLAILNIGDNDIEALTVEIPKQDNIEIKGANRVIVGSLDANDDSSFSFEAIPQDGEIKLKIFYTDKINKRRELEKTVYYDSFYFTDRIRDQTSTSTSVYVTAVIIFLLIIWKVRSILKKKKKEKMRLAEIHNRARPLTKH